MADQGSGQKRAAAQRGATTTSAARKPMAKVERASSTVAGARDSVAAEVERSFETVREMARDYDGAAPARVGESAADSNVTDEMTGRGVAFGELVKSVGLAVASAQAELDKNLRETAKALSETQIDVIAVFEQQTRDADGLMDKGIVHLQKLPLINYLMPTAYSWKRVHLEADMNVQEFNSRTGMNIQQSSFAAGVRAGWSFGLFGGGFSASA